MNARSEMHFTPSIDTVNNQCARLHETVAEALLEARDETDIRWIRRSALEQLDHIFSLANTGMFFMAGDYAIAKLDAMERLERETAHAAYIVLSRSVKWREALISRHFGK